MWRGRPAVRGRRRERIRVDELAVGCSSPRPSSRCSAARPSPSCSPSSRPRSRCACSASGAGGPRHCSPASSGGAWPRCSRSAWRTGTWAPTASSLHIFADQHPGDDGDGRRASTSWRGPARWRSASGPASSSRPRPLHAVRTRIAVFRALPRAGAARSPRGIRSVLRRWSRRPHDPVGGLRDPAATGARRRPAASTSSSDRSPRPASTCCRPRSAPSWPKLQNRVAAEPVEQIKPVLEAELGASAEELFAEFDWEPLAAASIGQTYRARLRLGRGRRRQGAATGRARRSSSATSPHSQLLADVAQRRTPLGQGLRSGELLEQFAQQPARRARLPSGGRRDGGDGRLARLTTGPVPKVYWQLCDPSPPRAGALRGFHRRRHRRARSRLDRSRRPRRPAAAVQSSTRSCGSASSTPIRIRATCSCSPTAALGLIDFGAVGRLDPIQQAAVVDMLAVDSARRQPAPRRHRARRRRQRGDRRRSDSSARSRVCWPRTSRRPARSTPPCLQDLVAMLAQFGMRLPGDLVVLWRARS